MKYTDQDVMDAGMTLDVMTGRDFLDPEDRGKYESWRWPGVVYFETARAPRGHVSVDNLYKEITDRPGRVSPIVELSAGHLATQECARYAGLFSAEECPNGRGIEWIRRTLEQDKDDGYVSR